MISSSTSQGGSKSQLPLKSINASSVSEKGSGTAKKAKESSAAVKNTPSKKSDAPSKSNQKSNKNMVEVDAYMKMISKFEQLMGEGEIGEKELNNMFSAMEKKIQDMEDPNKKKLLDLKFFKQEGITNISELKNSLIQIFDDEQQQQKGIQFLKSEEFTSLLLQKPQTSPTYSNQGKVATPPARNEKQEATIKMPNLKASTGNYNMAQNNNSAITSIRA